MVSIRGIDFGVVWCASGAQGFFGEGYPYQRCLGLLGWTLKDKVTFVAKTTTLDPRLDPSKGLGNMPLQSDGITPAEFIPACIKAYPAKGAALNAVGLSGPGVRALLKDGRWQKLAKPFWLSFMSVKPTKEERLFELRAFLVLLQTQMDNFRSPFGIQINLSCPNVGLDTSHLIEEAEEMGKTCSGLRVPVLFKISVQIPTASIIALGDLPFCDGIVTSNTVNWKQLPSLGIDPRTALGVDASPLSHLGDGGWSGAGMHALVCKQIRAAREAGFAKTIIGENETYTPQQAREKIEAGADGVGLGSISFLKPWNINATIRAANDAAERKKAAA